MVSDVDRHVRVWDWRSGQAMTPPLQILGQPSRAFAFSPDGAAIGLARRDGLVALWDFAQPVGDVPPIRTTDRVDHLVFSPDGARLAFAGYAGRAEIWDVARGERGVALTGHQEAITAITFSPDGLVVATSSYDKTVRVFDALTGRTISEPLRHEHAGPRGLLSRLLEAAHDREHVGRPQPGQCLATAGRAAVGRAGARRRPGPRLLERSRVTGSDLAAALADNLRTR